MRNRLARRLAWTLSVCLGLALIGGVRWMFRWMFIEGVQAGRYWLQLDWTDEWTIGHESEPNGMKTEHYHCGYVCLTVCKW